MKNLLTNILNAGNYTPVPYALLQAVTPQAAILYTFLCQLDAKQPEDAWLNIRPKSIQEKLSYTRTIFETAVQTLVKAGLLSTKIEKQATFYNVRNFTGKLSEILCMQETCKPQPEGVQETCKPQPEGVQETCKPQPEGMQEISKPQSKVMQETCKPQPEGMQEISKPQPKVMQETCKPQPEGMQDSCKSYAGILHTDNIEDSIPSNKNISIKYFWENISKKVDAEVFEKLKSWYAASKSDSAKNKQKTIVEFLNISDTIAYSQQEQVAFLTQAINGRWKQLGVKDWMEARRSKSADKAAPIAVDVRNFSIFRNQTAQSVFAEFARLFAYTPIANTNAHVTCYSQQLSGAGLIPASTEIAFIQLLEVIGKDVPEEEFLSIMRRLLVILKQELWNIKNDVSAKSTRYAGKDQSILAKSNFFKLWLTGGIFVSKDMRKPIWQIEGTTGKGYIPSCFKFQKDVAELLGAVPAKKSVSSSQPKLLPPIQPKPIPSARPEQPIEDNPTDIPAKTIQSVILSLEMPDDVMWDDAGLPNTLNCAKYAAEVVAKKLDVAANAVYDTCFQYFKRYFNL